MPSVMIQRPLAPDELSQLQSEFFQYRFALQDPDHPPAWDDVEILYGEQLTAEELHAAPRLRWIHVPSAHLGNMPLREIEATSNLLITNGKQSDVHQIAEFVIGTILANAKNLFLWHDSQSDPKALIHSPFRDLMWSLRDRILLQIGLGRIGSAVLELAQCLGMKTWGLQDQPSFHPHCDKTFSIKDLNSLLPAADVVSVAIPRGEPVPYLLNAHRLELMQPDSILVAVGSEGVLDELALLSLVKAGKFRGVVLDMTLPRKSGKLSPLYTSREVLVTPEVAHLPEEEECFDFRLFRFNFRRFVASDFESMRNLVRQV